jgi:hypothetical protein
MITTLNIERFKSIRTLELSCRRVNVFIGEPNTGKSNILEALGLLSWLGWARPGLNHFVRFSLVQNLFFDNLTDEPLRIQCQGEPAVTLQVEHRNEHFRFLVNGVGQVDLNNRGEGQVFYWPDACSIRSYRYVPMVRYESSDPGPLIPPHGPNLFSLVYGSRKLREWLAELFRPYGFEVLLEPVERTIKVIKREAGILTALPLGMASDTLQRILFYTVAMESNTNSVLVFEEPETHAFPYYTKYLGERIGTDPSNQYFLSTHNPYLLVPLLEKTPKDQVALFATQYRNYATTVIPLSEDQIGRLLDADPFLGLQAVLETE